VLAGENPISELLTGHYYKDDNRKAPIRLRDAATDREGSLRKEGSTGKSRLERDPMRKTFIGPTFRGLGRNATIAARPQGSGRHRAVANRHDNGTAQGCQDKDDDLRRGGDHHEQVNPSKGCRTIRTTRTNRDGIRTTNRIQTGGVIRHGRYGHVREQSLVARRTRFGTRRCGCFTILPTRGVASHASTAARDWNGTARPAAYVTTTIITRLVLAYSTPASRPLRDTVAVFWLAT